MFSIAITFVIGYSAASLIGFFWSNFKFYESYSRERALGLVEELKLGALYLKSNDAASFASHLSDSRRSHKIDFFLIRSGDRPLAFESGGKDSQWIAADFVPNRIVMKEMLTYGTVKIGDTLIVVGVDRGMSRFFKIMFEESRDTILIDIVFVVLMTVGIVIFYFQDIRNLITALSTRGREGLDRLGPSLTAEAEVIAQGLRAYETQAGSYRSELDHQEAQIAKSLRTEMNSGIQPPYEFECVLVRTDINGYSTIFSNFPVEEFMAAVNDFFVQSNEVIERYGGYITGFNGDEVIFYMKESEHENAAAVALSAIRDINDVADRLNLRTTQDNGYPFRVKSAMSSGRLRFGKHVNGFALAGGAFIESVRILSEIEERDVNSVFVPAGIAPRVSLIGRTAWYKSTQLRGVPGKTELYSIEEFYPCAKALPVSGGEAPDLSLLGYFRSDADLKTILAHLRETLSHASDPSVSYDEAQAIRGVASPSSDPELGRIYTALLEEAFKAGSPYRRVVSALTSLSVRLLSLSLFDARLEALFEKCLKSGERRVVSAAIEALCHFAPTRRSDILRSLTNHSDNRIMANALIKQGMSSLSPDVVDGLRSMISSKDNLFKASGAYAIGEIARYYRSKDLPFYETCTDFQELLLDLSRLARSDDFRVRRQYEIARKKAGLDRISLETRKSA